MEKELSNLRKAMNSSTHKGIHFTEIQRKKIRSSLDQQEKYKIRKPTIYIYGITTLAVALFALLFYTGFLANLDNDGVNLESNDTPSSEWKVRDEYSRNSKVLFSVYPDPNLSADIPYDYLFSFNEPFAAYKGKEIEIYATHKETGKRINVLPSKTITEPSTGYPSLGRFTTTLKVPESGLWKYEVFFNKKLYGDVVLSVEASTPENLPATIPVFVQTSDFEKIEWNRQAVDLGNNIIGNENKSGVIGADMPSININQKWMWHLWGIKNPNATDLTAVGFHKKTGTVHQIVTRGWTIGLGGENNGADAHAVSSVNIPTAGEWAVLLYVNEELFDILVYNIDE
ncbi:hypothetical protein [Virgibacillus sp. DJP39]|uniref:hypothetical protein n=1 Tax=Virgibacillus sp. DJP39 TaxID=3409790 RepID=UPI003BB6FC05